VYRISLALFFLGLPVFCFAGQHEKAFFQLLEQNRAKAWQYLDSISESRHSNEIDSSEFHFLKAHYDFSNSRLDSAGLHFQRSLIFAERKADRLMEAKAHHGLAQVLAEQSDSSGAFRHFNRALSLSKSIGNDSLAGFVALSLSGLYFDYHQKTISNRYLQEARDLLSKSGVQSGMARCLHHQALNLLDNEAYDEALPLLLSSDSIMLSRGLLKSRLPVINSIGLCFWNTSKLSQAAEWFKKGLELAAYSGERNIQRTLLENLAGVLNEMNRPAEAFDYLRQAYELKDSLFQKEISLLLQDMAFKYETAQRQIEINELKSESKRTRILLISSIVIVLIFAFLTLAIYRLNLRMNKANRILVKQKEEIQKQKEALSESKILTDRKNREITESIQYAYGLQQAILPDLDTISRVFPKSFILYQPKDIVAGDFYWFRETRHCYWFAVADCTGHGVPGAMVSVLAHNALNAVSDDEELQSTAGLLSRTRALIEKAFAGADRKDGMDISVIAIHKHESKLTWSGGNLPLWIIRNRDLMEWRPDKQPVGYFEHAFSFTEQVIELQKSDRIILFTDGFADQFGGESGKKLTRKRFREMIVNTSQKSPAEQKEELLSFFIQYRQNQDQVDDVLVAGIEWQ
jgi:serine phosphatase RsbU (regulator of sigma subunit)